MHASLLISAVSGAAEAFALWRLARAGVLRQVPWFAAYVAVSILQTLLWLAGTPKDHLYTVLWFVTMPFVVLLRIAVVVELGKLLMRQYPGIEQIFDHLAGAAVACAVLIAATGGMDSLHLWRPPWFKAAYYVLALLMRYSASIASILCGAAGMMMSFIEYGVRPNMRRHAWLLAGYFASISASIYFMEIFRGTALAVGPVMTGFAAGFFVAWGILITQEGRAPKTAEIPIEVCDPLPGLRALTRRLL